MLNLESKNILILGGGGSGIAAAKLACARKAIPTVLDTNADAAERLARQLPPQARFLAGDEALGWTGLCDWCVFSPGVPLDSPLAMAARRHTSRLISEHAFGGTFCQAPILAVTGTNGKTTTTEMVAHLLNEGGRHAIAAGNIGLPLSEVALQSPQPDVIVAETSSFQLELPEHLHPRAAVLLNITPDHLERHGSLQEYTRCKLAVFHNLPQGTSPVLNHKLLDLPAVSQALERHHPAITFSATSDQATYTIRNGSLYNRPRQQELVAMEKLPFIGEHNYENALAALALLESAGLDSAALAPALTTFHTGPHRIETIAQFGAFTFVDDSKATDVDAMMAAIRTIAPQGKPIALIAGGIDKGCSLDEALPLLRAHVTHAALIGSCAERLASRWRDTLPVRICANLAEAVQNCLAALPDGGVVLLSPGCSSFDMFASYAARGEAFRTAVKNLFS
ncbi:MAG: UDP-N-acetylmuramoyl-L-alanine--D-glutamate ligase [Victivallales bacterium]|nr:UDP-N-acetylmuramoyl-L-alanine--D-glutamate ligase [Victivallales bacterium]